LRDALQIGRKVVAQFFTGKAEGHGRLQKARFRAAIEPLTAETEAIDIAVLLNLLRDRIGQLNFTARAGFQLVQVL